MNGCRGASRGAVGHRVIQMGTEMIMEGCRGGVVGCKGECGDQRGIQCGMESAERVHWGMVWCEIGNLNFKVYFGVLGPFYVEDSFMLKFGCIRINVLNIKD